MAIAIEGVIRDDTTYKKVASYKKDKNGNLIEVERPKLSPQPQTEIIYKEKINNID